MNKELRESLLVTLITHVLFVLMFSSQLAYAQKPKQPPINVKTYIPVKAYTYLPMVKEETVKFFPTVPIPHYFGALIEQESCITLKHSRCWSPTSQLLSKRERGAGLGQITVAYNKDGSVRFDSLKEMRNKHMRELKELSWDNVLDRPDLQVRTMVLMTRDNYKALFQVKDPIYRLHMADAAYNGGLGGLNKERTQCGFTKGCDPQKWFGNVENIKIKSTTPIYGTRSPWDINREHPETTFHIRLDKYKQFF